MVSKILIADDDHEMLKILTGLLEQAGYKVIEAENGLEAVELAKKELPSLIMLDIHMPVMDGLTACRKLKADPVTKAIPVVMLTIEGSITEIEHAIIYLHNQAFHERRDPQGSEKHPVLKDMP